MHTTKTTCGQHRTLGYFYDNTPAGVVMICRGCYELASQHETTDETVARNNATR